MSYDIKMQDSVVQKLHTYCEKSTAEIEKVFDRILKTWLNPNIQKKLAKDEEMQSKMQAMGEKFRPDESEITGIGIDHDYGKTFKEMAEHHEIDPVGLATYLGKMFLVAHDIEKMNDQKKERGTKDFGSVY